MGIGPRRSSACSIPVYFPSGGVAAIGSDLLYLSLFALIAMTAATRLFRRTL